MAEQSRPASAPTGFGVAYRNPGHWDITNRVERCFRIRGEPGRVIVYDEREVGPPFPREPLKFRTVVAAMAWIADELMAEPSALQP